MFPERGARRGLRPDTGCMRGLGGALMEPHENVLLTAIGGQRQAVKR